MNYFDSSSKNVSNGNACNNKIHKLKLLKQVKYSQNQ